MPEHNAITDPNIHEPKDVASASAGEVYVADGVGSGNWTGILSQHAAAKVSGDSTDITPSGAGTFMEWTPSWTAIDQSGITVSSNSFVIPEDGDYIIHATLSNRQGTSATGTDVHAFDFAINGTVVGQQTRRSVSSTTDVGAVPVQAFLNDCSASDVIKLYVTNETDTNKIQVTDFVAYITRVA